MQCGRKEWHFPWSVRWQQRWEGTWEGKTPDLLFRVKCIWGGRNGASCRLCSGCRGGRLSDYSGALSDFLMGGLGLLWNVKGLRGGRIGVYVMCELVVAGRLSFAVDGEVTVG